MHHFIKFDNRSAFLQPDDIIAKLKDQLPDDQQDMLLSSIDEFLTKVDAQHSMVTFGTLISKFTNTSSGNYACDE